jgi:hypothetical protein
MKAPGVQLGYVLAIVCAGCVTVGRAASAAESWDLAIVGTLSGGGQGAYGAVSTTTNVKGTVTLQVDGKGILVGAGEMSVSMVYSRPPTPGVSISPLAGRGEFTVKGRRDGDNLIFGIERGSIVCNGTMTVKTPAGTQVTPMAIPFDPSVFTSSKRTVIERREGATASQKINVTAGTSHVTGNAGFTLSGGTGVVPDRALPKGKFPAKENRWTLELECDFTMETHAANVDATTDTSIRGRTEFPLPLGDGEAKGTGSFSVQCSSVMSKPTPTKQSWTADGDLILDGRIEKDVLTFLPRANMNEVAGSGTSPVPFRGTGEFSEGLRVLGPTTPVSIPVDDHAEVVQQLAKPGSNITKGRLTWRLLGKKRELWRITLDGRDRVWMGAQPKAIKKPKIVKDPNAPDVKWSDAVYGLKVLWRIIIDVEIEDGRYERGNCTASLVSVVPFSEPSGVYNVKAVSVAIREADGSKHMTPYLRHPAFPVRKGVKTGRELYLDLYYPATDGDLGSWVAYRAVLNEQEAAKKIAFWKLRKTGMRRDVSDKRFSYFPTDIFVLLVDGWTKAVGDADSIQSESYVVRRIE